MSGGSYSYLCYKEFPEICEYKDELQKVEHFLIVHGCADIAADCRRLIEYIQSAEIRINVLKEQLNPVLHAVEWYESADIGKESLHEAIENYRSGRESKNEQIH